MNIKFIRNTGKVNESYEKACKLNYEGNSRLYPVGGLIQYEGPAGFWPPPTFGPDVSFLCSVPVEFRSRNFRVPNPKFQLELPLKSEPQQP